MNTSQKFLTVIKNINQNMKESSQDVSVLFGQITSIEPIAIQISQKLILDEEFLVKTQSMDEMQLQINDQVMLLRVQGGQQYILLDKVVS